MTREEIIRMAKEACVHHVNFDAIYVEGLEEFAALVAAAEREACAALAEKTICDTHIPTGVNIYGTRAARAIRARGNT